MDPNRQDRTEIITKVAKYIAKTNGKRFFPWRTFIISDRVGDLIESNLNYKLATENKIKNTDWIKPGKVAWDWWNALNLKGVDFKPGVNLETYKYYVDFAAKYGIEYVILDEGWSISTLDILRYKDEINVEELIDYATEKKVGIILWTLWKPLDENMEEVYETYQRWGVKGVKIDFMQRADQLMVNFYERSAKLAADYELIVDYHGAYKPTGLNRTYPNILNYEGLKGLEHVKWSNKITPEHDLILPFIRMSAGPMDYTPGAMINKHPNDFKIEFNSPMSIGTRAHQVSMYTLYDAPLQMLADSPTNFENEHETTGFISKMPTTWDNTIVLKASISEYLLMMRQKGDDFYLAAMTNSNSREFKLSMSFLDEGVFEIEIFKDGPNANTNAQDYILEKKGITRDDTILIKMAKGGGWTGIIRIKK